MGAIVCIHNQYLSFNPYERNNIVPFNIRKNILQINFTELKNCDNFIFVQCFKRFIGYRKIFSDIDLN